MQPILVVLCTCPDADAARRLASALVEERLAACVNVLPGIRSIYRWEGAVNEEGEALMLIKTAESVYGALENWLGEHHPYELPEIIALPPTAGLAAYLDWVARETSE